MKKSKSNILPETPGEFHLPAKNTFISDKVSCIRNVFVPKYDLTFTQKSIAFSDAILQNEIPVSIKKTESLDSLKDKSKAPYLKIQNEI